MKLLFAVALFSLPAYAGSGWQVNLYVFSSVDGHTLSDDSYIAKFRIPAQDEKDCNRLGNAGMKYFESGHLPDASVTLSGFSCEEAP